jgi:hypothetical protein
MTPVVYLPVRRPFLLLCICLIAIHFFLLPSIGLIVTTFPLLIFILPAFFYFVFHLSLLLVVINFVLLLLPIFLITWADLKILGFCNMKGNVATGPCHTHVFGEFSPILAVCLKDTAIGCHSFEGFRV